MRAWLAGISACAMLCGAAKAGVILTLPTSERVVALTFDACEQQRPVHLDTGISDYLVAHRIPFTVFLSGKFVADNEEAVRALGRLDFVELENHSWDHPNNMRRLSDAAVRDEVATTEAEIARVTGRRTQFFRFPAITYDTRTLNIVEAMGYRVVHYRWEVGDPDPHESANRIVREIREGTRPGDIEIFHINGRGWHTAEALPRVIEELKADGYRFVLLKDYLKAAP